MKKIVFSSILLLLPLFAAAQPDRVYKSLKEVKNPDSVYILKLNYKRLKAIPPKVFTFRNLQELDLGKNFIDSIPPEIGNLRNLKTLKLNRNRIRQVPPELGRLTALRTLNLSRNPILELPDEMASLTNLEELVIWCTGIVSFPPSFVALGTNLKLLDMRVCPLTWDDQQAIEDLLPDVRKRWDYVCNCN